MPRTVKKRPLKQVPDVDDMIQYIGLAIAADRLKREQEEMGWETSTQFNNIVRNATNCSVKGLERLGLDEHARKCIEFIAYREGSEECILGIPGVCIATPEDFGIEDCGECGFCNEFMTR